MVKNARRSGSCHRPPRGRSLFRPRHFVGSARWWAAGITGADGDADADYAAGDFFAAYEASIAIATEAFGGAGVLERTFRLPIGEFPGSALLAMAATEQFAHGWDLARAIGYPADFDQDLAAFLGRRV